EKTAASFLLGCMLVGSELNMGAGCHSNDLLKPGRSRGFGCGCISSVDDLPDVRGIDVFECRKSVRIMDICRRWRCEINLGAGAVRKGQPAEVNVFIYLRFFEKM